jgi:DNA primase
VGIQDDDVVRVRETTDIVALVGEHLQLKRVGRRFVGLCPFHGEKSPSFSVNPELGLYYCFGCQAKGDAITFVREMEHLDFVGAVEKLAHRSGITLRYTDHGESEGRKKRAELTEAMAAAVAWYHTRLLEAPDAAAARGYLRSRGFDGESVRRYRLGWAPEGWDELVRALGLPSRVLVDAGLAYMNQRNRPTDSFRGRVLFPIFDPQGDPVAFGGRIMPGGQGPKYKNSPETRLYDKSKVLYGLNWHKASIVATGEAIVCEGYTDVIGFARAGLDRAVATCGTSLTDEHVRLLQRFARRVVLAFDADAAGQAAAERFYGWERSHDLEVHVADLPGGEDPGDLAQRDPERLRAAVEGAKPFLRFRFERVLGAANLDSPEGRAKAAQAALAVLAEHPDELVRDQYRMELSDRCRIDIDRLRAQRVTPAPGAGGAGGDAGGSARGNGSGRARRDGDAGGAGAPRGAPGNRRGSELEVLRFAVHDPAPLAGHLDELLFTDPVALSAYRALANAETFHAALTDAEPAAAELLQRLAVEEPDGEADDVLARLVEESVRREVANLEAAARQHNNVEYLRSANVNVAEAKLQVERLREPSSRRDATGQLLGWLQDRAEERHD